MPVYWVNRTQDGVNAETKPIRGPQILVLGVTYKRDTRDTRESPALDITDQFLNKGASVSYHDPYVPSLTTDTYHLTSISDSELGQSLADADCVGIVTDHSTYDWERVRPQAALIVDTRNALGREVTQAGASPVGVSGRPSGGGA
jgi:UDP-N-acetyl-D-glucosamine dehydrogenase